MLQHMYAWLEAHFMQRYCSNRPAQVQHLPDK